MIVFSDFKMNENILIKYVWIIMTHVLSSYVRFWRYFKKMTLLENLKNKLILKNIIHIIKYF